MIVKLMTEHHLELLSFKGGCIGSYGVYTCHIVGNVTPWLNYSFGVVQRPVMSLTISRYLMVSFDAIGGGLLVEAVGETKVKYN